MTKPSVGAEIFLSTEWQAFRHFPDVRRDTFCGNSHAFMPALHTLRSLGLENCLLSLSAAADCKISPFGGCLLALCLLSSLKVEFCYSSVLSFSLKDSYKGELRSNACPRSSLMVPHLQLLHRKALVAGATESCPEFFERDNCHALKPKSLLCIQ